MTLICYESVSAFKDFNIKWHYITLQNIYDKFKGNIRKQKIEALNKHWQPKYALKDKQGSKKLYTLDILKIKKVLKHSKNYSDGELVKWQHNFFFVNL